MENTPTPQQINNKPKPKYTFGILSLIAGIISLVPHGILLFICLFGILLSPLTNIPISTTLLNILRNSDFKPFYTSSLVGGCITIVLSIISFLRKESPVLSILGIVAGGASILLSVVCLFVLPLF